METKILNFLSQHRVCSFSVLLPDGSPHSASMHYSHQNEPLKLFFSTETISKKCETLLQEASVKASVVVGFSEEEWLTLQMDGEARVLQDPEELKNAKDIYYPKNPQAKQYEADPTTIFLVFTPSWYRFTDFKVDPPAIISGVF